ncbi:MAG: DUF4054 domain-containing protein [Alphaproteobacteria bacterium]|nr:DUF4054 domain-containing protein [Alphaproteobacteria bacterium]
MPYTTPTPDDLRAVFPAFTDTPDATVEYWITRAERSVDATWSDGDRTHATLLLACHLMTLQGLGTGAEAEAAAAGASGYKVMQSGSLRLERFDSGGSDKDGGFGATQYGRQFLALLRLNKGGPRITGTGTVCFDPQAYPQGES